MIKTLEFHPAQGLHSHHLQMCFANFGPKGDEPPSFPMLVPLPDGAQLSCEVSTPVSWKSDQPTIVLVHGLSGSHRSAYMVRVSRKLFKNDYKVVRVNLRGCGSGKGLSSIPYHAGNSHDVKIVLQQLKRTFPFSPLNLIGFSLGGNIAIKLGGEMGDEGSSLINYMMAICPPVDLPSTIERMSLPSNWMYHRYFLRNMFKQAHMWVGNKSINSLIEFDNQITAPYWGYKNGNEYYETCSSRHFLSQVRIPCDVLFAADDPFIDYRMISHHKSSSTTNIYLTSHGSHVGFIARSPKKRYFFWMDQFILDKMNTLHKSIL